MKHRATIVMAAGKGTRMKDPNKAKVMYEIFEKPMVHYVVDLALALESTRVLVIVGHQREVVIEYLRQTHPAAECIVQAEQLGTGHAVMQARKALDGFRGDVIVLSGDVPMLTRKTMDELLSHHAASDAVATILTAILPEPAGYGRIIRNQDGSVRKIVEHRDATPEELLVLEINSGIYVFEKENLFEALEHIGPSNVQQEYYLTDVFNYFSQRNRRVSALITRNFDEIRGINTIVQLEDARRLMKSPND